MENIEILKENCKEYAKTRKGIDVLRKADGTKHYTEIAKTIKIHSTKVSSLLKKAEKLGLAKKIRAGVYKKIPGVLGYMPRENNSKNSALTIECFSQKIAKKRVASKVSFPKDIKIPSRISVPFGQMAEAYQYLYVVENSLRELIRKVFSQKTGWWKNNIPNTIQLYVEDIIKNTPYHAAERGDMLEYTHLGQLKEIIICKKNWNDFLTYLKVKDKNDFSATIDKAIPSRNAIGHCIPLKPEDLKIVGVRLKDILQMVR